MFESEFRTNLNLLPSVQRRRVLIRTGLTFWGCIAAISLSLASLVVWRAERALGSVQSELSKFTREYAPTQMMAGELAVMRKKLVDLRIEEEAAADLEDDRPTLALLGVIGQASRACNGQLHVRECLLKRSPPERGSASTQEHLLSIRGVALDVRYVAQFHGVLTDSGMFASVEFQPTTHEQVGDQTGQAFEIECAY